MLNLCAPSSPLTSGGHALDLSPEAFGPLRVSSDTRYQLASETADERWVGEAPIGHGERARRGVIC